ncbi:histone deacetylase family protein [Fulvivirga lutimaris]|uniref:histone deacetylase family protein n=1 Tax=Fulvivirga lutimaris TaxID=1819566 RepID=UPI0012BB50F5|nr:histone deacetylase [Fulvivirga lutimaris]MTI40278.1 histone deacetylase [Fulvivirga lutimaris]
MLKIAWSKIYNHPLPAGHRFPMEKYDLLPEQLLHEGTVQHDNFFHPRKLTEAEILSTHDAEYWEKLKKLNLSRQEERRSGFPLSSLIVEREITINAGTIEAADYALQYGVAMNIAGGTHHAYTNRAEGFCFLNDIAIAANYLLDQKKAKQILVVDLDVHQGNGTAEIFQNDTRVFTFSMHGEKNYPMHKEKSDLDLGLADGTDDKTYLKLLAENLKELMQKVAPDFIFFQSGVDVLATDKLGRLGLSIEGCKRRDELVLKTTFDNQVPLVASMGGGYSEKIRDIIEAHANTYRLAQEIYF